MYQHGETFSAHELLPSRLPNQCVLCSCTVRPSTFLSAQARGLGLQSVAVWTGASCSPWLKQSESEQAQGEGDIWDLEHPAFSGLLHPPELPVIAPVTLH